jgi:hypothetical protein
MSPLKPGSAVIGVLEAQRAYVQPLDVLRLESLLESDDRAIKGWILDRAWLPTV